MFVIDFVAIRKAFAKSIKKEKQSGAKKVYVFQHTQMNQVQYIDTKEQFDTMVELYKSQGIMPYKILDKSDIAKDKYNLNGCRLHVFRKEGQKLTNAINQNHEVIVDKPSIAFDYLPADCEWTIAEVFLNK